MDLQVCGLHQNLRDQRSNRKLCLWSPNQSYCKSRNSFRSLQCRTVRGPMIAKTVLAHVVSWWCRLHFWFTFTRLILSQLHSDPMREVFTILYQLFSYCIANFIQGNCPIGHKES
ncbi:MAG: hypothetical protein [Circular genetic element sp.]|nr:MAG: hypothetical protein [Circular genetic element sp.]